MANSSATVEGGKSPPSVIFFVLHFQYSVVDYSTHAREQRVMQYV